MDAISYSYARQNLAEIMRQVCDDRETVIITAPKRKVVMISLEDYNAVAETDYLLSNPANAAHLRESLRQLDEGEFSDVRLEDV
jgi:antitoxin YefM